MAITFTSTQVRSDTSVPWYTPELGLPVITNIRSRIEAAGITTTATLSEDQLTRTVVDVCETEEQAAELLNCVLDLDMRKELDDYHLDKGMQNSRTISGVGSPFSITTTYSFPAGTDLSMITDQMPSGPGVSNIQILTDSASCTNTYNNEESFNTRRWSDRTIAEILLEKKVTKSHTFTKLI